MDRFLLPSPTNNIKALKIKICYGICTPTMPTWLDLTQLSASVADCCQQLSWIASPS